MESCTKKKKNIREGVVCDWVSVCQCWPIREVRIGKQMEGRPLATVIRAMPLLLPNLPFSKIKKKHRWSNQQMARSHFTTSNRKKEEGQHIFERKHLQAKMSGVWKQAPTKCRRTSQCVGDLIGKWKRSKCSLQVSRQTNMLRMYTTEWTVGSISGSGVSVVKLWTRDNVSTFRDGGGSNDGDKEMLLSGSAYLHSCY